MTEHEPNESVVLNTIGCVLSVAFTLAIPVGLFMLGRYLMSLLR